MPSLGMQGCEVIIVICRAGQKSMTISTDAAKAFEKIQHPLMIKILIKLGTEGTYSNVIKNLYMTNPQLTSHSMGKG